jgi:hypothetical protein
MFTLNKGRKNLCSGLNYLFLFHEIPNIIVLIAVGLPFIAIAIVALGPSTRNVSRIVDLFP